MLEISELWVIPMMISAGIAGGCVLGFIIDGVGSFLRMLDDMVSSII